MSRKQAQAIDWIQEARALVAECIGTFALTFTAASATVITTISHHEMDYVAKVTAPGLMVMAMIYTFGNVSGAHINPAVTLAFALRRAFSLLRVPGYILMQLLGAVVAALILHCLFGSVEHVGATLPHYGILQSVGMEIILTMFLVTVIIGTATGSKVVGPNAGIAVGGTIMLCGMIGSPVSGASMNPALSFGPSLVAGKLTTYRIYLISPMIGSLLAVLFSYMTHGKSTDHEQEAASGKGKQPTEHK
jgi:aquaporin Z